MECFEADPHRVRRIRKAAVRKRVGHEQIAELVVDPRSGNGKKRKGRKTNHNHATEKNRRAKHDAAADSFKRAFDEAEECFVPAREKQRGEEKKNGNCGGKNHAAASPSGRGKRLWF